MNGSRTMVQCKDCGTTYEGKLKRCPECESKELVRYEVENPYSQLPMEDILKVAGHLVWITGIVGSLIILWNTDQKDDTLNWILVVSGFGFLGLSVILSVTLFGLGELLRRVIRVQRRVRAFMNEAAEVKKTT